MLRLAVLSSAVAFAAADQRYVSPIVPTGEAGGFCDGSGDGVWEKVWADEFDQDSLDNSTWTVDLQGGDSRVRNSQGTADNVYLEDGKLVLRSQKQVSGNYNYTSGAVQSQDKRYWSGPTRICVSAALPGGGVNGTVGGGQGAGIWPAHWLMPNTDACWPTNGEIDIMEMINGDGVLHGTYHWSNATCNDDHSAGDQTTMPRDWAVNYHEYAVEYTPEYVAFVVDGRVYKNVSSSKGMMYDVPWYVILNTAVGGTWPQPPANTTVFPTYHRIDYVRVAQKKQ